ncbi:MAG: cation:proton antiporter [Cyanobacteriota bacterium]|nr:cation:proton antiporter [Cyanobacteriota bacterium]
MSSTLALLLTIFGALLLAAGFLDEIAARIRLPGIVLVLLLGLLTDNRVHGGSASGAELLSLDSADQIAQIALVLVLFFGGLTTNWRQLRPVLVPAGRLATLGSGLTALLMMALVLLLGTIPGVQIRPTPAMALFVGAMLCSTDASAVLALLRPLAGRLPQRLIDLIECESAFNDPMAVVLCGLALAMASGSESVSAPQLVIAVTRQFLLGGVLGFLGGTLGRQILVSRSAPANGSQLAVLSLAVLALLVGGTQLLGGSGILAAYVAGLVLGNGPDGERALLQEAHAGFAKIAELLLFLCMGLVVDPEQVVRAMLWGVVLFAALQLVRWLTVEAILWRGDFGRPERAFITMAGLRGAVPIAMAIQAAARPIPWGEAMPPLALAVVLLGLLLQGLSLVPTARRLGLASPG